MKELLSKYGAYLTILFFERWMGKNNLKWNSTLDMAGGITKMISKGILELSIRVSLFIFLPIIKKIKSRFASSNEAPHQ